jgi:hypothetical protein
MWRPSGDLTVFDLNQPGLVSVDCEHPETTLSLGRCRSATHRVYFPLEAGPNGTPVHCGSCDPRGRHLTRPHVVNTPGRDNGEPKSIN